MSEPDPVSKSGSFTDQQRRVADEETIRRPWGGGKNGQLFRCYLCGHRFQPGDGYRWVYTAGASFTNPVDGRRYGVTNFTTCDACDGPDVLDRWVAMHVEFYQPKWWTFR